MRIELETAGCFHHEAQQYVWVRLADAFTWRDRRLSSADMAALRKAIAEARHEVPGLLAEVGITPESLAAHRDEIVAMATPEAFRREGWLGKVAAIPAELEPLLAWDRIAPLIRDELLGRLWTSTERRLVRATFLMDGHELVVESKGLVPWMLPWKVTVDGTSFTSEDLAVPRALLKLVDPKSPWIDLLDGSSAWPDYIWTNGRFWDRFVGREIDHALSAEEYTRLDGWSRASERLAVRSVRTESGDFGSGPRCFELESKLPAAIDRARWDDRLVDRRPAHTWDDFLALYHRAEICAEKQHWLLEWKRLDPKRHIMLHASGTDGFSEDMIEELVMPAWQHAGFSGRPEFELLLREDQRSVGRIYLSSQLTGALIDNAHLDRVLESRNASRGGENGKPATAETKGADALHWFDDLAFSYHPRADPPTYGRVDADGRVEVRTMPRVTKRPR